MKKKPPLLLTLWIVLLIPTQVAQAMKPDLPAAHLAQSAFAVPDPTFGGFGSDGTLAANITSDDDVIDAIAIQPADGRIIAVGYNAIGDRNGDFAVARYLPDGTPDVSFSGDGKAVIDFDGHTDTAYAVAIQPDGKIVVAGRSLIGGDDDFSLARFNPDGGLDTGFGPNGKVTTGFGGNDYATSVVILPGGKILVGGYTERCTIGTIGCDDDFALARYNSNGFLDPAFDGDGKLTTDLGGNESITNLVVQDDGKIVAGGPKDSGQIAIARYLPDGQLDPLFDHDGLLSTGLVGDGDWIDVQPNHVILLVGYKGVARLMEDGQTDPYFGNNGIAPISSSLMGHGRRAIVQPDGKIVVAGSRFFSVGGTQKANFALLRFDASGNPDQGFGENSGYTSHSVPTNSSNYSFLNALIRTPNGELMAAGATQPEGGDFQFALARYFPDGTLDSGGRVITKVTDFSGIDDHANSLAVGMNGSILLAGSADTGSLPRAGGARYTPRGQLDDGFASHGLLRSGVIQEAHAVAVDPNGYIYLAGSRYLSATSFDFALLKFKPDGSSLASGFGPAGQGFVATDLGGDDDANALALTPDGGFAVAGTSGLDFAVVKYTLSGLPDPTFDQDGIVTTGFGPNSVDVAYVALSLPDGKILVAGRTKASGSENDDFALARYNPNGSLDPTFNGDGLLTIDFAGEPDTAYDLALAPDGKYLAVGTADVAGVSQLAAARINPDGSLDPGFSSDGKVLLHHGLGDNDGYAVGILSTGGVAIAGCVTNFDLGRHDMDLDILNPDGSPSLKYGMNGFATYSLGGDSCAYDMFVAPEKILLAGFASNGWNDNYALLDIPLVQSLPLKLPQLFLPLVFRGP